MTTPSASGAQPTQASSTSPAPAAASPGAGAAVQQPAASPGAGAPAQQQPAAQPAAPQPNLGRLVIENRKLQERLKLLEPKAKLGDDHEAMLAAFKDPEKRYEILEKHGIRYDEFTDYVLRRGGAKPDAKDEVKLPKEVADRLAKLDEIEKKIGDRESTEAKQEQERRVASARAEAARIVTALGDDAELVATFEGYDAVVREWQRVYGETGVPPDDGMIAKSVEQKLEGTLTTQLGALLKAKKGKALIAKALGVDAQKLDALIAAAKASQNGNGKGGTHQASPQAKPGQKGDGTASTLTNEMSAEPGGTELPFHKLSAAQKRELAHRRSRARVAAE